jgi:cellobiose transport system permease protein
MNSRPVATPTELPSETPTQPAAGKPADGRRRKRVGSWFDSHAAGYVLISPYFVMFAIFGLFPLVFTFWVSLHDWSLLGGHYWVGLANYRALFQDDYFYNALRNTLAMFVIATVPQLIAGMMIAHLLNRPMRSRTLWRMSVLLPNITSVAAVGIIFTLIFARDFGLANWLLDLVGIDPVSWKDHQWSSWVAISVMVDWRWTGYNTLIFLAALQAVPNDLYEAAELDGAGSWRQFRHITVPMLRPTLIFVAIISTIGGMQLFTEPLIFNSGANAISGGTTRQFQTLTMYLYEKAFPGQEFGYASTIAWVMFGLIAVIGAINVLLLRRMRSAD